MSSGSPYILQNIRTVSFCSLGKKNKFKIKEPLIAVISKASKNTMGFMKEPAVL
jgi:hypothetical protein